MPSLPDRKGHFGVFGGRYVAETIMPALTELEAAYRASRKDKAFRDEFHDYLRQYSGKGNAAVPGAKPHGKNRRGRKSI